jgi:hypothetical protein
MGGLVMKLQYLIPFILLLSIVLGACNGQYNNELNNQIGEEQVTSGEENQQNQQNDKNNENNKKEDTTKENETAVTLEETEAKKLMSQYRTHFEEIILIK